MTRLEPGVADVRMRGRIAVVTGASRGLGQAIAVRLARAGAALAVTARDTAALAATVRQLDELGVRHLAVTLEVRDRDSIRAAVAAIEGRLGPVDILVNNAGVQRLRPALEVSEDDWTYVLDTNLRGMFFCCQEVGRWMMTRRRRPRMYRRQSCIWRRRLQTSSRARSCRSTVA
jgi:NAD(P)-dependent dehydrogenase (short-subunit alcohol dehydrogenase family)